MLKKHQNNELQRINVMKQSMQENAEHLAERYEDIKDKQEELTKRFFLFIYELIKHIFHFFLFGIAGVKNC